MAQGTQDQQGRGKDEKEPKFSAKPGDHQKPLIRLQISKFYDTLFVDKLSDLFQPGKCDPSVSCDTAHEVQDA